MSIKDPQTCDVDPTKVDPCVSTEEKRTCDGSIKTTEPVTIKVDADVSTEEQNKKRGENKTETKVDACVSTEKQQTCDATTTTDSTVVCSVHTQTNTRMDGDGAAAEAKSELQLITQKIQELEKELALSRGFVADFMLKIIRAEQEVRKYAEEPVISWADDCDCRQNLSSVADLLKSLIFIERDAKKLDSEATCVRKTKVDCEIQTVSNSRQMNGHEQEAARRLQDRNRQLTVSVERYERKISVLKEQLENMEHDRPSHIQQIKWRYEEDNHRQILKMTDMREELLWYKEQCFPHL